MVSMTHGDYLNESNQLGALLKFPIGQRICKKNAKKTAYLDFFSMKYLEKTKILCTFAGDFRIYEMT